jgi:hypothetical protein
MAVLLRRSRVVVFVHGLAVALAMAGLTACKSRRADLLALHGMVTCGVFSAVALYSLAELLFAPAIDAPLDQGASLPDGLLVLLVASPFMVDFLAGALSLRCANALHAITALDSSRPSPESTLDAGPIASESSSDSIAVTPRERLHVPKPAGDEVSTAVGSPGTGPESTPNAGPIALESSSDAIAATRSVARAFWDSPGSDPESTPSAGPIALSSSSDAITALESPGLGPKVPESEIVKMAYAMEEELKNQGYTDAHVGTIHAALHRAQGNRDVAMTELLSRFGAQPGPIAMDTSSDAIAAVELSPGLGPEPTPDAGPIALESLSDSGSSGSARCAARLRAYPTDAAVATAFWDGRGGRDKCCVCDSNPRNAIFRPCAHRALCDGCARAVVSSRSRCPICRAAVDRVDVEP